ncbi:MAG: hypothetical protein EOP10_22815 [Proteobacteria bacterium]|nr:MAG: hypothetical protein EOP10_22815 [Pseudomonadota bacterium]
MSPGDQAKFNEIAKKLGKADVVTDYGIRRGRLQIEAQRLFLSEKKMHAIHDLVEDDAARANHEAAEIEEVGMSELKGNTVRFVFIASFFAILIGGLYYYFRPEPKPTFNALNSLIYEADVMNENSEGRINYPTDSVAEVNEYFGKITDLGFTPKSMKPLPAEWKVLGASLIDYGKETKITVTQFQHTVTNERMYLFFYAGKVNQLPKSTEGNSNGLVYNTYATSSLSVMAWQSQSNVVGMMIGSRSGKDLSDFAQKVVGP